MTDNPTYPDGQILRLPTGPEVIYKREGMYLGIASLYLPSEWAGNQSPRFIVTPRGRVYGEKSHAMGVLFWLRELTDTGQNVRAIAERATESIVDPEIDARAIEEGWAGV